LKIAH